VIVRTLLVTDFFAPHVGGVELQVGALAEALAERGGDVCVVTMWQPNLPTEEVVGGVRVVRLRGLFNRVPWFSSSTAKRYHPPIADPAVAIALRRLVRSFRPDVVQAYGWIAHSCALGLVGSGVPLILSVNDFGYTCTTRTLLLDGRICDGPGAAKCLRHAAQVYGPAKGTAAVVGVFGSRAWLARRTRIVRSVSNYAEMVVRRDLFRGRAGSDRVVTIPDIVLVERPSAAPPDADPGDRRLPRGPYILFVGALQPHKGIDVLLQAYRRLVNAPPLVLVGTRGPDTPDQFPSDVTVIENLEHAAVMRAWDRALLGVAPSICADALPGVVREAMSRGVPVVGSRVGGIVDMIEDQVNGLLVEPGDIDGLAAAMQALLDDPGRRADLGAHARLDVARYVPDAIGAAFERLYEDAVVPPGNASRVEGVPARIHITGGSGTGKTTLAGRLAALLDAPVHHLDDVAREANAGRVRSLDERARIVEQIAAQPRWVTEGIHVGWTDELCRRADAILWLDHVGWPTALMRVLRRFVGDGLRETRRQRGIRGLIRPRSYWRHLSELIRAGRDIRSFGGKAPDLVPGDGGNRSATIAQLAPFTAKVVRCRSGNDIEAYVARVRRRADDRPRSVSDE
jgi:glycosyltransferase involved in cell wall biosynthesis